jgi:hypothetical protein
LALLHPHSHDSQLVLRGAGTVKIETDCGICSNRLRKVESNAEFGGGCSEVDAEFDVQSRNGEFSESVFGCAVRISRRQMFGFRFCISSTGRSLGLGEIGAKLTTANLAEA